MEVEQDLHMNAGEGDKSYANNSLIQKEGINKMKPIIEESIVDLYMSSFPECLKIVDMGCSSGPNTLLVVSQIMDVMDTTCRKLKRKAPMFQVFLNDLPGNDFNNIFKSLPSFYEKVKKEKGDEFGPCFIAGMPGSFYGRLFPDKSLHFVHSSYSLHWRSQVPRGLVSESGIPLNKGNVFIAKTSPPSVHKAYLDLFEEDFTSFLRSRSAEVIPGGHMVLIMNGSDRNSNSSDYGSLMWELLGIALHDMVLEGLIEEEKLDYFNVPYFGADIEEVRHVIEREGSFAIHQLEVFKVDWEDKVDNLIDNKSNTKAKYLAKILRAVKEPILASHFGEEIMDDLFDRYAEKIADFLKEEEGGHTNMIISLAKK